MDEKTKQNNNNNGCDGDLCQWVFCAYWFSRHFNVTLSLSQFSSFFFFFSFPYIIADTKQSWAAKQEIWWPHLYTYLFILIRRHCNEGRLFEHVRPERAVRQLENVVCPDEVKTRLVLVHGVEYRLLRPQWEEKQGVRDIVWQCHQATLTASLRGVKFWDHYKERRYCLHMQIILIDRDLTPLKYADRVC